MAQKPRKPFLLRVSPALLSTIERLAGDELRSANAQVEVLLREALARRGIKVPPDLKPEADDPPAEA